MSDALNLSTDGDLLAHIAAGSPRQTPSPLAAPVWNAGLTSLVTMSEDQLMAALAIRRGAARRLLLAFALHRRLLAAQVPERAKLNAPDVVAQVMRPLVQLDHERLWCLALDPHCRLIGAPVEVARGDVDGTDASARAICRAALRAGATSMIIVHNHPAGDPSPSPADAAVTRRIVAAGRAVDVPLADHVVMCADGRFASLRRDQPELFR